MKACICYVSVHHGNTKKIANVLGKELTAKVSDLTRKNPKLDKFDLIGFGSGIFFWKHHKKIFSYLDSLKPVKNKKAFIFSTSGFKRTHPDFHTALRKKLREKGFYVLNEFNCPGWDTVGPLKLIGGINKKHPDEFDISEASQFAKRIKALWR